MERDETESNTGFPVLASFENIEPQCQKDAVFPFKYLISPYEENSKKQLWASPVQLSIALKCSPFAEASMDIPHINKGKNTMIIATKKELDCDLNRIVLGTYKITCKLLPPLASSLGVIGLVDPEEDLSEIKSLLVSDGYPVLDVSRITKRSSGNTVPTQYIKIGFSVKDLPSRVIICGIPYRVRSFVPSARQCFNCQRFGHMSRNCRSKARCLHCGGNHAFKDCKKEERRCVNCGGEHLANYGGCPNVRRAQEVEVLAWRSGKSYTAALEQITASSGGTNRSGPNFVMTDLSTGCSRDRQYCDQATDSIGPTYAKVVSGMSHSVENESTPSQIANRPDSVKTAGENAMSAKLELLTNALQSIITLFRNLVESFCVTPSASPNSTISEVLQSLKQINFDKTKKAADAKLPTEAEVAVQKEIEDSAVSISGQPATNSEIQEKAFIEVSSRGASGSRKKTKNSGIPTPKSQFTGSSGKGKRTSSDAALNSSQTDLTSEKKKTSRTK